MTRAPSSERQVRYRWAAEVLRGGRVLDVGCGSGWGTALLAGGGAQVAGVDFAPPAIAAARDAHGGVAAFHECDLAKTPFGDGEFDGVVCFEAIARVPDAGAVLDELRRVLRPGGLLLVSSPNRGVYPAGNPLLVNELTPDELEAELATRFAHVALYRQQAYFASLLGDAGMLSHEDADTPIEAGLSKLSGDPPGSELHTVAAASEGELPATPAEVALGEQLDYEKLEDELLIWRQRAIEAEAELLARRRADRK